MTSKQFSTLTPGQHVRLAGHTAEGIVIRISRHVPSALVRWRGGDISWEEYYRLEVI